MRSFLGRLNGLSPARIHIIPDCPYVVLSGYNEEARGQYLRGKIMLTTVPRATVKGVQLRLVKVTRNRHHSCSAKHETTKSVHGWHHFLLEGNPKRSNLYSNSFEWPFEIFIPGNQTETFKGCLHCSLTYRLEAATMDDSPDAKQVCTFTPIRIIRCPTTSSYELLDSVSSHGKWNAQAEYNVSIRHQAIPLGGLIPIDVSLAPLDAGVEVSKAAFVLRESHLVHKPSTGDNKSVYMERTVEEWPLKLDTPSQDMHTWQECLNLPRIVGKCSPDFSVQGMNISHSLHFMVSLVKDGIVTEHDMSMPITLFISPEFPVSGWDMFLYGYDEMTQDRLSVLAKGIGVPPQYCERDEGGGLKVDSSLGTSPPAYTR